MTAKLADPANYIVAKFDDYGYPHFAMNGFYTKSTAEDLATLMPGTKAISYGEYKRTQDPDEMSENALRKRLGMEGIKAKKIAITGTISGHTRASAIEAAKKAGYEVTETVSAALAFVWAGEKAGSKATKARALGIPVLGELA